jgi:hypothetical protein
MATGVTKLLPKRRAGFLVLRVTRLSLGQACHAFEGEDHIETTADLNGILVWRTICPSVSENVLGKPVRKA